MRAFPRRILGSLLTILLFCGLGSVLPRLLYGQETTGGLQGTVRDQTGAVVPRAKVGLNGTTLVGSKELVTDSSGYYRFANLPPGTYTLSIT